MIELPRIGVCGCGNMGSAIVEHLGSRTTVTAFDLDASRVQGLVDSGHAEPAADLAEIAGRCDRVVLSLPSPAASLAVVGELAGQLRPGSIVVETSTLNPSDMRELRALCDVAGVGIVDAAILAGVEVMRGGRATLLVGGDDDTVAAVTPVLDLLSPRVLRLGALGTGMAAKVVNNAVSHAVMVVLVEALAMAKGSGVDLDAMVGILADPDAGLLRPLSHRVRERVLDGSFEGGMPLDAALKDSTLAQRLAESLDVPLFAIRAAQTPYEIGVAAGLGRQDYAVLAKLWEDWTGRMLSRAETKPQG